MVKSQLFYISLFLTRILFSVLGNYIFDIERSNRGLRSLELPPKKSFASNVSYFPYPKPKYLSKDVDEDAAMATEDAIVISDGVGGWNFTSKHTSKLLVNSIVSSILTLKEKLNAPEEVPLHELITSPLYKAMDQYNLIALHAVEDFSKDRRHMKNFNPIFNINMRAFSQLSTENKKQAVGGAGTLLAAYLKTTPDGRCRLRVMKAGDSLLLQMGMHKQPNGQGVYYLPALITDDEQKIFNTPNQLSTIDSFSVDYFVKEAGHSPLPALSMFLYNDEVKRITTEYDVPVSTDDILVFASDGLYDNLSVPLISIFINYVLKKLEIAAARGEPDIKSPESLLHPLIDQLYRLTENREEGFYERMFERQETRSTFAKTSAADTEDPFDSKSVIKKNLNEYYTFLVKKIYAEGSGAKPKLEKGCDGLDDLCEKGRSVVKIDLKQFRPRLQSVADDRKDGIAHQLLSTESLKKSEDLNTRLRLRLRKLSNKPGDHESDDEGCDVYDTDEEGSDVAKVNSFMMTSLTNSDKLDNPDVPQQKKSLMSVSSVGNHNDFDQIEADYISEPRIISPNRKSKMMVDRLSKSTLTEPIQHYSLGEKAGRTRNDMFGGMTLHHAKTESSIIPDTNSKDPNSVITIDQPDNSLVRTLTHSKTSKRLMTMQNSFSSDPVLQISIKKHGDDKISKIDIFDDGKIVNREPVQRLRTLIRTKSQVLDLARKIAPLGHDEENENTINDELDSHFSDEDTESSQDPLRKQKIQKSIGALTKRRSSVFEQSTHIDEENKRPTKGLLRSNISALSKYRSKISPIEELGSEEDEEDNNSSGTRGASRVKQSPHKPSPVKQPPKDDLNLRFKCNLLDLMDYPIPTEYRAVQKVPMSECVIDMIKSLAVSKNYLTRSNYSVLSQALAGAAKYFYDKKNFKITPFGVKALQFGRTKRMSKPDDITVVATMILRGQTDGDKRKAIIAEIEEDMKKVFSQLSSDVKTFLGNVMHVREYFYGRNSSI